MLGQKRLLFVDDERGVRETLAAILRRYGFTVTAVANTPQALEQIQTNKFDLLLCDLNIDGLCDGFDVIRAMKAASPHCAVFVLTGYPSAETAIEAKRMGIDDYITKPTDIDGLVASLANKLGARAAKMNSATAP